MLLNQSALALTCQAPKLGICGAGSVLSEYELYFHFASQKYPHTMNIRHLLWANGPKPGMLYTPMANSAAASELIPAHYSAHPEALTLQSVMDQLKGYHYVGIITSQ